MSAEYWLPLSVWGALHFECRKLDTLRRYARDGLVPAVLYQGQYYVRQDALPERQITFNRVYR